MKTRRVVFVAVIVDWYGEAMTERERETVEEREEDVDDADDLAALVPKMLTRGEPVDTGNDPRRAERVWCGRRPRDCVRRRRGNTRPFWLGLHWIRSGRKRASGC